MCGGNYAAVFISCDGRTFKGNKERMVDGVSEVVSSAGKDLSSLSPPMMFRLTIWLALPREFSLALPKNGAPAATTSAQFSKIPERMRSF